MIIEFYPFKEINNYTEKSKHDVSKTHCTYACIYVYVCVYLFPGQGISLIQKVTTWYGKNWRFNPENGENSHQNL